MDLSYQFCPISGQAYVSGSQGLLSHLGCHAGACPEAGAEPQLLTVPRPRDHQALVSGAEHGEGSVSLLSGSRVEF